MSFAKSRSGSKIATFATSLFANETILLMILANKRARTLRTSNGTEDVQRNDARLSGKLGYPT